MLAEGCLRTRFEFRLGRSIGPQQQAYLRLIPGVWASSKGRWVSAPFGAHEVIYDQLAYWDTAPYGIRQVYRHGTQWVQTPRPLIPRDFNRPEQAKACMREVEGLLRSGGVLDMDFWENRGRFSETTNAQRAATCFLAERGGGALEMDCGLGKTGVIVADLILRYTPLTLFFCKAGPILEQADKIEFFAPKARIGVIRPAKTVKVPIHQQFSRLISEGSPANPAVAVCSYSIIQDIVEWLLRNPEAPQRYDVGLDESHMVKDCNRWDRLMDPNSETQYKLKRNRSASGYLLAQRAQRVFGVTADFFPNGEPYRDGLGQLQLFGDPTTWGSKEGETYKFAVRYGDGQRVQVPARNGDGVQTVFQARGRSNLPEFKSRLKHFRIQVPFAAGAPKGAKVGVTEIVFIHHEELVKALGDPKGAKVSSKRVVKRLAKKAKKEGLTEKEKLSLLEHRTALAASMKRRRVRDKLVEIGAGRSRAWLAEQGFTPKVVVWTGRLRDVEELVKTASRVVRPAGGRVFALTGSMTTDDRAAALKTFLACKQAAVAVCTRQAMGESADMGGVTHTITAQLPYTIKDVRQQRGRTEGFRSLKLGVPTRHIYLIAEGTIDEDIREILLDKKAGINELSPGSVIHDLELRDKRTRREILGRMMDRLELELSESVVVEGDWSAQLPDEISVAGWR